MSNYKLAAAALSALLLVSCGDREAATVPNGTAEAQANALDNAGAPDPGEAQRPEEANVDTVPPPDAVSHPNGFLPGAEDAPTPPAPEPEANRPPGSNDPPPATEDEYIRNGQAGR